MSRQTYGQIAALEFFDPPEMDFPDIVEELDIASQRLAPQLRRLTWDGDDIALIDRDAVRIALGWLPGGDDGQASYLVLAVGPRNAKRNVTLDPEAYEMLTRRLVERVRGYLPFDAVLHGTANRPIGSALIDMTFELLSVSATEAAHHRRPATRQARTHDKGDRVKSRPRPKQPIPEDAIDAQVAVPGASLPMRLTIVTFGLTLFLHVPPLGAALLTYTTLREAQPLFA
ncbi:MAG: hypothetical protein ACNA7M_04395 [Roseovarius sp.]